MDRPTDALPANTWHAGAASAATRAAHRALRRRRWPHAPGATVELGGTPALAIDYLDAAALRRWWPQLDPDAWVPAARVHAAWAPWTAGPAPRKLQRRACRRLARDLGRADGELARALAAPGEDYAAERAGALAGRLRDACPSFERGPPGTAQARLSRRELWPHRLAVDVWARPGGPDAWRVDRRVVHSASASTAGSLRWQVLGVGEAVLQRRLAWADAADGAASLRLVACYGGAGHVVAWAVGAVDPGGAWHWFWHDPAGRLPRAAAHAPLATGVR